MVDQFGQPKSLKDVLATAKRKPTAVFGVGLGVGTEEGGNIIEDEAGEQAVTEEEEGEEEKVEPPLTPLTFNISSELFTAAQEAAAGTPESYWSHTMYQQVQDNGTIDKVKVHHCKTKHSMEHVCKSYFLGEPILGFDMEWMAFVSRGSGPRENVSLIQVASPSHIGLFHVALFPKDDDFVAPTFREIMGDPDVSKVGVNILADCTRLKTHLGVNSRGIFELSHLYRVVKYLPDNRRTLINKKLVALSAQVEDQLGLPLYKGESVRSGNWMKALDESQLRYSAADAYAGVQLYHVLETKRQALEPCPQRPFHAELGLPIPLPDPLPEEESSEDPEEKLEEENENEAEAEEEVEFEGEVDALADEVTVEEFDALTGSETTASTTTSKTPPTKPVTKSKSPKATKQKTPSNTTPLITADPRIVAAELKMEQYRSSKEKPLVAKPSSLRAYYIWADDDTLTPDTIAGLLRDPPLQTATVVTYIIDAIKAEKFPYSKDRARRDLVPNINPNVLKSTNRYTSFIRACQLPDE
ncbi:3'-5' exonuclease [Cladobotryum mycophilum]|uniref:3'-5' exonuclease n=1 Tax=Cladobotryum mycophilum TaxID=491253 RepID=A0ABR0SNB3_9HYPO